MDVEIPRKPVDKGAIVTGASRGIGRAIALRLARDGARVVVGYASDAAAAQAVVGEIAEAGGSAWAVQADLRRVEGVRRLFAESLDALGRLDILVNNAADASFGPLVDVTEEEFDSLFALNVKGAFFALQEAARRMENEGRIVNLSSGVTILGAPQGTLYGGTKGALEQFSQAAARELAPRGITVNTVSAGMTRTDLLDRVIPADVQARMAESTPLGRLGRPEDIAEVVAFLCRPEGGWVTAQNIRATGGAS
jgi:3-oxoacyl-[acyl-carrier protein] reductase